LSIVFPSLRSYNESAGFKIQNTVFRKGLLSYENESCKNHPRHYGPACHGRLPDSDSGPVPQGNVPRAGDIVLAVLSLMIIPVLAYPLQNVIPGFKGKGRDGQRKLAFIFTLFGYLAGTMSSAVSPMSPPTCSLSSTPTCSPC
jgi:hypothetical protein